MIKWEYLKKRFIIRDFDKVMNDLGDEGWELQCVEKIIEVNDMKGVMMNFETAYYECIFKRQKQ